MIFLIWKRIVLGVLLPRKEMSLDLEEDFSPSGRGISANWKRILRFLEEDFPIPRRGFPDSWKNNFRNMEVDVSLPGRRCSSTWWEYQSKWKRMFSTWKRMFLYVFLPGGRYSTNRKVTFSFLEKDISLYLEEVVPAPMSLVQAAGVRHRISAAPHRGVLPVSVPLRKV